MTVYQVEDSGWYNKNIDKYTSLSNKKKKS